MDEWENIPVRPSTKKKFDENTTKNLTYDEAVNALLDFWLMYRDVVKKGG